MSTKLATIKNTGKDNRDLRVIQFSGGSKGIMIQLTQTSTTTQLYLDEPAFIQLTPKDCYKVIIELTKFIQSESNRKAEKLKEEIIRMKELEKTIIKDAVECERFIADLKVLDIPLMLL